MTGVRWFHLLSAAAVIAACLPVRAAEAAAVEQQFQRADAAIKNRKLDEGLTILQAMARDSKLERDWRMRALWKIVEVDRGAKNLDHAIATTNEMIALCSGDNDLLQQIYSTQCDLFWSMHKTDQAVEACHQIAAHAGDDRERAIGACYRAISYLQQARDFTRLDEEATQLLRLLDNDPRTADALWIMVESAWQGGRCEECLEKARRIIAEYPNSGICQNRTAHQRVVDCLRKLGRNGDVGASYEEWEKKDPDRRWQRKWCFSLAECYSAERDPVAALAAFRRVISGHCDDNVSEMWYEAENRIVDLLAASGDVKAALEEAHILFDAAQHGGAVTQSTHRIAGLFNQLDKDSVRADRFIAFQYYGPDGPDGTPGTEDDLTNPLDEIGYPADRERKQAFAKAFANLGNDAAATCHRGTMCLYAGRPKDALFYFMEAARRSEMDKFETYAVPMIVNGLRAVRGHAIGLQDAVGYVLEGPGDGRQDPFQPYASLAPQAPFTVSPSPRDVELLTAIQASLMTSAADGLWPVEMRYKALAALARLNEALDAWPKTGDWYRELLPGERDGRTKTMILSGALAAARGNVLHLGNVRASLASFDSDGTAEKHFRTEIRNLEQLEKPGALAPQVKPRKTKQK